MEFRLLGLVEARRDGVPAALSGSKIHTVLAALLLARGRVVSDARLSYLLWGWSPPATLNAQIYTYVSRLRKQLPGIEIARQQPGYVLRPGNSRIDLLDFERLDKLGQEALRQRDYVVARSHLAEALDLWQGPALANVTEYLSETEIPQWEDARATTLENRTEADLALGRHQEITAELTGLVTRHPERERLRAQLMLALYRSGRQADALHVYHHGRRVLADELGVDPGPELEAAYQTVLRGERSFAATAPVPSMLPADTLAFTGRDAELASLQALLAPGDRADAWRPRRFLITGMAGVGKTALAVRAAHACAEHFPDGLLYADLRGPDGSPKDPCDVLLRLLRALGETGLDGDSRIADDLDELTRLYRTRTTGKRILLVLDNACSDLQLASLLPGSPDIPVLITAQTPLTETAGAHTTTLAPLDEDASYELLRAAAGPGRITGASEAVREILGHCAGLPLALRIAGARLAARPHWSAVRLADRLADPRTRLRELSLGDLDVREALRQPVRRLAPATRALLGRLPLVGPGPFHAAAAATVFGLTETAAEEVLEQLVDVSLLDLCGMDPQGMPIYRLHPLVRLLFQSPFRDAFEGTAARQHLAKAG
ncbi:BTAD domain-containing putative transcriptional regulator [Streptomyces sp. NPDC006172]|uniref:AfsR/SARP family transcriptional regulator n=1 Tax=Streptomyces sp. NPDC006172 TaxID=3154470 RepID=UPI0033FF5C1C